MKGKLRKLLSVVVATAMTLSCLSVPALAESSTTVTNNSPGKETIATRTFDIYQVFTGYAGTDGSLGQPSWGYSGIQTKGTSVDATIVAELEAVRDTTSHTDTDRLNVIEKYVDFDKVYSNSDEFKNLDVSISADSDATYYTVTGLPDGYYLIRDKSGTQDNGGFYTLSAVRVSKNTLTFATKGSVPSVSKQVTKGTENTNYSDNTTASIGDVLTYKIEGTTSSKINDYETYYYVFSDKLSTGLTLNGYTGTNKNSGIKVYYNSVSEENDISDYFYREATVETDGTSIKVGMQNLKLLENIKEGGTAKYPLYDAKIIVVYSVTLNEDAIVKDPNKNTVQISYSNDPNNSGTGDSTTTPPTNPTDPEVPQDQPTDTSSETSTTSEADVYTTALTITKTDENGNRLGSAYDSVAGEYKGAVFELVPANSDSNLKQVMTKTTTYTQLTDDELTTFSGVKYYQLSNGSYTTTAPTSDTESSYAYAKRVYQKTETETLQGENQTNTTYKAMVGTDGVLTFYGVGAGTYTLTEVNPPDGYNAISPMTITISFDSTTKQFSTNMGSVASTTDYDGVLYFRCENEKGTALPTTGGIGTTIFYVSGTILVLGAAVALITRRRMKNEVK